MSSSNALRDEVSEIKGRVRWEVVRTGLCLCGEQNEQRLPETTPTTSRDRQEEEIVELLRVALDALKPSRSPIWRQNLLCREGRGFTIEAGQDEAEAYADLQGRASKAVTGALITAFKDNTTGLDEALGLVIEVAKEVDDYIDAHEKAKRDDNAKTLEREEVCHVPVDPQYKSFAALNACLTGISKLVPVLVRKAGWLALFQLRKDAKESNSNLLKWFLQRIYRETSKYVDSGGDKRLLHVLRFWNQHYGKTFNFRAWSKPEHGLDANYRSKSPQCKLEILSEIEKWVNLEVLNLFFKICRLLVKTAHHKGLEERGGEKKSSKWRSELMTNTLTKVLPFGCFVFEYYDLYHQPVSPTSAFRSVPGDLFLAKLCLDEIPQSDTAGGIVEGVFLFTEMIHHYGKGLCSSTNALAFAASKINVILDTVAQNQDYFARIHDHVLSMLVSVIMQCMKTKKLWNEMELLVTKIVTGDINPLKFSLILGPWSEALKSIRPNEANKYQGLDTGRLVRTHLKHLIQCMVLISPNMFQSKRSMMVSEQLAVVVCTLVQQGVVDGAMLMNTLNTFDSAQGSTPLGHNLGLSMTKLCLFQCCPRLISRLFLESSHSDSQEDEAQTRNSQVKNLLDRTVRTLQKDSNDRKRKCGNDSRVAMDTLEHLSVSKKLKPWHTHAAVCAFELLCSTPDSPSHQEAKTLHKVLSKYVKNRYYQHYIARVLAKLPVLATSGIYKELFHHLLQSQSFALVHLGMDALVQVTKKPHEGVGDCRDLVPKQIFNFETNRTFMECLEKHLKKLEDPGESIETEPCESAHLFESLCSDLNDLPWCSLSPENEQEAKKGAKKDILEILRNAEHHLSRAQSVMKNELPVNNQQETIDSILSSVRKLRNQMVS